MLPIFRDYKTRKLGNGSRARAFDAGRVGILNVEMRLSVLTFPGKDGRSTGLC